MNADELLTRCLKVLQGAIRASSYTQTDVDEMIGRRRGYLSHVFQRRVDLKMVDLMRALESLDVDPRRFLEAAVGGQPEERPALGDLLHLLAGGGEAGIWNPPRVPETAPAASNGQLAEDPELLARVREAVVRIVSDLQEAHTEGERTEERPGQAAG